MSLRVVHEDNLTVRHRNCICFDQLCGDFIDQSKIPDVTEDIRPFYNIKRGLAGVQKKEIWNAVQHLYAEHTYELIKDAFKKLDLKTLAKHPKFKNETEASLESLSNSFRLTTKIERTKHLTDETVGLKFTFLSDFKTFDGESIWFEVPIILRYKPSISWQMLMPAFQIGKEK